MGWGVWISQVKMCACAFCEGSLSHLAAKRSQKDNHSTPHVDTYPCKRFGMCKAPRSFDQCRSGVSFSVNSSGFRWPQMLLWPRVRLETHLVLWRSFLGPSPQQVEQLCGHFLQKLSCLWGSTRSDERSQGLKIQQPSQAIWSVQTCPNRSPDKSSTCGLNSETQLNQLKKISKTH